MYDTINLFGKLNDTHTLIQSTAQSKDVYLLATEACNGYILVDQGPRIGSWERGQYYATDILNDLKNFAVGWTVRIFFSVF